MEKRTVELAKLLTEMLEYAQGESKKGFQRLLYLFATDIGRELNWRIRVEESEINKLTDEQETEIVDVSIKEMAEDEEAKAHLEEKIKGTKRGRNGRKERFKQMGD